MSKSIFFISTAVILLSACATTQAGEHTCPDKERWSPSLQKCVGEGFAGDGGVAPMPHCDEAERWSPRLNKCVGKDFAGDAPSWEEFKAEQAQKKYS